MANFLEALKCLEEQKLDKRVQGSFDTLCYFVESGLIFKSDNLKFICKNWRLSGSELAYYWSATTGKEKSNSAFRSQRSAVAKKLENALDVSGQELLEIFTRINLFEINRLSMRVEVLLNYIDEGQEFFACNLIPEELVKQFQGRPTVCDVSIADCGKEIKALQEMMLDTLYLKSSQCDRGKLIYLIQVLNQGMFRDSSDKAPINEEKVKLLTLLTKVGSSNIPSKGKKDSVEGGIVQALREEAKKGHLPPQSKYRDDIAITQCLVEIANGDVKQGISELAKYVDFSYLPIDKLL